MITIQGNNFKFEHTAVALGKFDGLHRGHQVLFDKLAKYKEMGYKTVIFTFDFHPMSLLSGKKQQLIYTRSERIEIAKSTGVDVMIEFPFTPETAHMLPEDFISSVLIDRVGAKAIVVGDDFHFGYQRAGDVKFLKDHAGKYGYIVDNCEKLCVGGEEVGATMIRELIKSGDMEMVTDLLGRPYKVTGAVIPGKANGRKVSMPTANIAPDSEKLLPPDGVYASRTYIKSTDTYYNSITNIGRNPTVSDHNELRVETFIFDFNDDLYEKAIEVYLYKRIRPELKFESLNALRAQVAKDQIEAENFLKTL